MVLIATIERKRYLMDVGFGIGGSPRPVPMIPDVEFQATGTQTLRLRRDGIPDHSFGRRADDDSDEEDQAHDARNDIWILEVQHSPDTRWWPAHCFSDTEFLRDDFEVLNYNCEQNSKSWFANVVVVIKFLMDEDGVVIGQTNLTDREVARRIHGKSEVLRVCTSEEERIDALERWFGIVLTEEERNAIRGRRMEILQPEQDPETKS